MNKDILKGKWKELKGEVKGQWGDLTDDQLTQIDGNREKLSGEIQKTYGYAKDRAEKEIKSFEDKHCNTNCDAKDKRGVA